MGMDNIIPLAIPIFHGRSQTLRNSKNCLKILLDRLTLSLYKYCPNFNKISYFLLIKNLFLYKIEFRHYGLSDRS